MGDGLFRERGRGVCGRDVTFARGGGGRMNALQRMSPISLPSASRPTKRSRNATEGISYRVRVVGSPQKPNLDARYPIVPVTSV